MRPDPPRDWSELALGFHPVFRGFFIPPEQVDLSRRRDPEILHRR